MRPEQRIAADLGLTTADLEAIVRLDRAKRLAPKMERATRKAVEHIDELCRMVNGLTSQLGIGQKVRAEDWGETARTVLRDIDRPVGETVAR